MTKTTCLPRNRLKEYLNGWISTELQSEIESHLQECPDCEQTIVKLENDPDTLLEVLHAPLSRSASIPGPDQIGADSLPESMDAQDDSIVAYAMERASRNLSDSHSERSEIQRNSIDGSLKAIGPYTLLQPLGQGGMGAVFLAQHQQLGKQVAMKLLSERAFRQDPYAARFQREIRTAGKLAHPAIVNATDAGTSQGMHYLVMEYIDGFDLSRIAKWVGPLPVPEACKVAQVVALGLSHAHAEGVVHRDIKPSNVMLSRTGQVKILDFGLAQTELWGEASAELTTVGQLMGTLDYMSPEQAEKANGVDYRADLYSLGAMLFRLVVGRAPLAAAPDLSPLAKLRLLATSDPPSLGVLRPDLPGQLIELVDALLQRDPSKRPASAAHVAESLEKLSEGADLQQLVRQADLLSQTKVDSPSLPIIEVDRHTQGDGTKAWMTTTELTSRDRRQRNSIGFWVALAMVPLLVLGGILVVLETSKGQLVIESEVANVEVKLLKDGKEYDTIQVLPGTHTTRLQAGKYEVLVDASSDRFSIDRDQVVLKRGETVIARISMRDRQPALGTIDPSIAKSTRATASDELLYEGRTLDQWLNVLERDRSVKSINDSLQAVKALVTKRTAESIGDRLLKMMPDLDGHIQLGGDGEASQPLDYKVASVLRQCYRESSVWTKKLCSVMDASDDRFAHRLLSKWHFFRTENDSPLDASLFLTWALEKVFSPRGRSELALPSAEILRAFSINPGYSLTPSEHAAIVETLVQSPVIPRRFFLEALPDSKSDLVWGPVWANAVQRQAIERLMDDASTESEKVMSVTTLRLLRVNATRVKGLEAIPDVPGLVAKVVSELTRLSKESELFQTCVLADSYLMEAAPVMNSETVGSERVQTGLTYAMTIHRGEARGNFALELIRLLKVLPVEKNESLRKALEVVIQKCQPNVVDLLLSSETNPHGLIAGPPRTIAVSWPNLVMQTLNQSSSPNQEHAIQLLSYFLFIEAFDDLVKFDPSRGTILDDLKRQWSVQMVKRFDQDRNGTTSVDEADEGIRSRIWRGFGRAGNQEESTSLFDKNGDGLIEGDELHNCLTKLRKDVSFPNKRRT